MVSGPCAARRGLWRRGPRGAASRKVRLFWWRGRLLGCAAVASNPARHGHHQPAPRRRSHQRIITPYYVRKASMSFLLLMLNAWLPRLPPGCSGRPLSSSLRPPPRPSRHSPDPRRSDAQSNTTGRPHTAQADTDRLIPAPSAAFTLQQQQRPTSSLRISSASYPPGAPSAAPAAPPPPACPSARASRAVGAQRELRASQKHGGDTATHESHRRRHS